MERLTARQINAEADAMLRYLIARHCHGRPSNVDRVRRTFNKLALAWVRDQKKQHK